MKYIHSYYQKSDEDIISRPLYDDNPPTIKGAAINSTSFSESFDSPDQAIIHEEYNSNNDYDRSRAYQERPKNKNIRNVTLVFTGLLSLLLLGGFISWLVFGSNHKINDGLDTPLMQYANQYAPSIAFVFAQYWIKDKDKIVYRKQSEGTAFLVGKDGYLLTSRHVACPWLIDPSLDMVIKELKIENRSPDFGYRLFLWFDGEKAFNLSAQGIEPADIFDKYNVQNAYRTDGKPRLTIAAVARDPEQTGNIIPLPFGEDLAILKIEKVPDGLQPIPLDINLLPTKIPKLLPIITMGFPLGSQTLGTSVNVSASKGYVRRSSRNLLQIDLSFYEGNSGGPIIDSRGKVIGIATGVASDSHRFFIPVSTPLWNMAMALPITRAVSLLQDTKSGKDQWDGILEGNTAFGVSQYIPIRSLRN